MRAAVLAVGVGCIAVGLVVPMERPFLLLCCTLGVLLLLAALFELQAKISAERLTAMVLLSALSVAGRIVFTALPNVQPSTFIIAVTGVTLGWQVGLTVGMMTGFLSSFVMGFGPFTPWMMLAWGCVGLLAAIFAKPLRGNVLVRVVGFVLLCGVYSVIVDGWTIFSGLFGGSWWAVIVAGLAFQVPLMVFTAALTLLIGGSMIRNLDRIAVKYGLLRVSNE